MSNLPPRRRRDRRSRLRERVPGAPREDLRCAGSRTRAAGGSAHGRARGGHRRRGARRRSPGRELGERRGGRAVGPTDGLTRFPRPASWSTSRCQRRARRPRQALGSAVCGEVLGRITGDLSTWTAEVRRGPPGEPRRGPGGEDGRPRSAGPYVRGASRRGAGGGTPGYPPRGRPRRAPSSSRSRKVQDREVE